MNTELLVADAASQSALLLDETIACLQELYDEQDKRKHVVSDKFDITEYLQYLFALQDVIFVVPGVTPDIHRGNLKEPK